MFMLNNTRIAGPAFWHGTGVPTFRKNVLLPYSQNRNLDKTLHLARKLEVKLMSLKTINTVHVAAVQAILLTYDGHVLNCVRPSGYCEYMYRQVLTFSNSTFYPHSVFMCFAWISEQTAIISLYSIN